MTLCGPMNCSPPGSSVHGIFQARILEWVAISSSRGSSQPRDPTHVCCIGRWVLYHQSHLMYIYVSRSVVSDSLRPHGLQPTSFLHPWEFPGKSTGVGAIAFSSPGSAFCVFHTPSSPGLTIGSGCNLMAVRSQVFSFPSVLRLTLEGWNC